eukprot:7504233-Lingulodinium_polyedra.AAC.1
MGIAVGRIFQETGLFCKGIRPAVNVGLFVSRVGGAVQVKALRQVAGMLELELAQYREVAAFAQFGSDLDASMQHQLLRGGILTELLKQMQFVPMMTQEIIVSLWSGTRGYLLKVAAEGVLRFETLWVDHVCGTRVALLAVIVERRRVTAEIEAGLQSAMTEFLGANDGCMHGLRGRWSTRASAWG